MASLLGVAGGELLIPTLVLLFGLDLKLAGSVSLAISFRRCLSVSRATAAIKRSLYCAPTAPSCWPWLSDLLLV